MKSSFGTLPTYVFCSTGQLKKVLVSKSKLYPVVESLAAVQTRDKDTCTGQVGRVS